MPPDRREKPTLDDLRALVDSVEDVEERVRRRSERLRSPTLRALPAIAEADGAEGETKVSTPAPGPPPRASEPPRGDRAPSSGRYVFVAVRRRARQRT